MAASFTFLFFFLHLSLFLLSHLALPYVVKEPTAPEPNPSCLPFNCRKFINITYPFLKTKPKCGNCEEGIKPTIKFEDRSYVVKEILYEESTLVIQDEKLHNPSDFCKFLYNFTMPTSHIHPIYLNAPYYTFLNCKNDHQPLFDDSYMGVYNYTGCDEDRILYYWPEDPQILHHLPPRQQSDCSVTRFPLSPWLFDPEGLFSQFEFSFGIQWNQTAECNQCHKGKGFCTHNPSTGDFDCFRMHPVSAKPGGKSKYKKILIGKLQDGRFVAIKRLYQNNYQRVEQFKNEVNILSRLRHQNLVMLYGFSSRHSRDLLLVYEFIPNGTVADHLHGDRAKISRLTWSTRIGIAIETADALAYLHNVDIIHRDVKTDNILLDNYFCVKVADFGLSRLFPMDVTHVSTVPQGTPGYVDPDYHRCYQLTDKSDVYSFGVFLIELVSSLPAVDITRHRNEINLANMAINKIQNDALHELVDPTLGFDSDFSVRRMIISVAELAFRCLQDEKEVRPSMEEVLEELRGIASEEYKVEKTGEVGTPMDDIC